MKRTLLLLTACGAMPFGGFAQTAATPPPVAPPLPAPVVPPPEPPPAPAHPANHSRPGVFLGVEVTPLPSALSDQLDLPEGFGVLVDYVVPNSPADTAGVKAHDVLKMLNDQILTGAGQLAVLVHSFKEGQEVTLVVQRKGQETRLTAKIAKHAGRDSGHSAEVEFWRDGDFDFDFSDGSNPEFADRIRQSIDRSRAQVEAATARANEQARQALEAARERTARAVGRRYDFDGAHVVLKDSTGRLEIRSARGKRTLTVRDADGKTVFTGSIDTPEQRKAIPADVLPQVEALEREQIVSFPDHAAAADPDAERVE